MQRGRRGTVAEARTKRAAGKQWATWGVNGGALLLLLIVGIGSVVLLSRVVAPPPSGFSYGNDTHAPEFQLPRAGGQTLSLAQFRGQKPVLLYFNMGLG